MGIGFPVHWSFAMQFRSSAFLRASQLALLFLISLLPLPLLAAVIGPSLQQKLAELGPLETIEIIVSYDQAGPLSLDQIAELDSLSVGGFHFQQLPMAGVLALAGDIDTIAALPKVQSVWLNEELAYDNDRSTDITGVNRLRTDPNLRSDMGLPYSGRGITVLVNDSGVDGQHPDLPYPEKVVQNVAAQTNLNSLSPLLPVSYIEDIPDTDILGGHGTHVAGTIAGTGAASGGQFAGVAPGANIIGYGSGAGLFILDTLGGFDYALVNQFRYNIRVISNSFGSPGDTGTAFDPNHPTNIATRRLAERHIIVVFSAGNSGPGEDTITGNFKKAPWVVTVGAGDSQGNLANFSSRGIRDGGGEVEIGGELLSWVDRPNIVAPGVSVISARAKSDPLSTLSLLDGDPTWVYYHALSGTSMAAPHVSGIVALMLEANPMLSWRDVIEILEATATNMPGRESWEVGAGYVNAHAAVTLAAGLRDDYGQTLALNRNFNASVDESRLEGPSVELFFSPIGLSDEVSFDVAAGLSTVTARANVSENTVALVLTDPDGNRYGSGVSLPLLGPSIAVSAPATPGTWTIQARGIGAVSGVSLDPLGLTNGTGLPGSITARIGFMRVDGFSGLDDIAGHPAQGLIEKAVAERLLDGYPDGSFRPDQLINRIEVADYLSLGAGLRQFRPTDGSDSLSDVDSAQLGAAEAASARGGALRDRRQQQAALLPAALPGQFDPEGFYQRADFAYALVQALGLEIQAGQIRQALEQEAITVAFKDQRIALEDDAQVPAALRGHVQLALDLNLLNARFSLHQGPFDLLPTVRAHFDPQLQISRAQYAFGAVNLLDRLRQAD
jgi:serine protease AprX